MKVKTTQNIAVNQGKKMNEVQHNKEINKTKINEILKRKINGAIRRHFGK